MSSSTTTKPTPANILSCPTEFRIQYETNNELEDYISAALRSQPSRQTSNSRRSYHQAKVILIDGNIGEDIIEGSTTSAIPESPTADPELLSDSTFYLPSSDAVSESTIFPEPTATKSRPERLSSEFIIAVNRAILQECETEHPPAATRFTTTTYRDFDEPVTSNSPNVDNHNGNMPSTQLLDSPTPVPFIAVLHTIPGVPTPTPTPTSMMNGLIFKDTTVELASRDDWFLTDSAHLVLELNQTGKLMDKSNLLSRESMPGVWDADKPLILHEFAGEFTLSVLMQLGQNERQLVGSMELNGTELLDMVGTQFEIPLLSQENYPDILLRTKVSTIGDLRENTREVNSGTIRQGGSSSEVDTIKRMFSDGITAFHDFGSHGTLESLEQAISNFEAITELIPEGDPNLPGILSNLGAFLLYRFERLGQVLDINNSIERLERATALTVDSNAGKPGCLTNLGNSLQARFRRFGEVADIDSAIAHNQAAVELTPDDHPSKPSRLTNLGVSLRTRFERLGEVADIDSAIVNQQAAVELTPYDHPDKPGYLSNLGNSFQTRFERFGEVADINSAIIHKQAAIELTPDDHPDKPSYLNNLGNSLGTRFERFGEVADIDSAIVNQQAGVELTPNGHPHKPRLLNNLGASLQTRFKRFGEIADIDSAIIHKQASIELTPDDHPDKPGCLNNLGNSLRTRFERFGELVDIDSATVNQQAAIELTPNGHPDKPGYLNNLGVSLRTRFERLGEVTDIDSAIVNQQAAIELTPDDQPDKPSRLTNLGASLRTRFERFGEVADINSAIIHKQAAVELTPDGHPHKSGCLNNLGLSLQTRFQQLGDVADIDSAIFNQQEAVNLDPDSHPQKTAHLRNLGTAFRTRFLRLHDPEDAKAAILYLSLSAISSTGPPSTRFDAVRNWISIASLIGHESLLSAYECAIALMPLIAWLGLSIPGRHNHLVQMGGIARDAAAAAISLKQYDKALEWLEQGRSIVWNQILQLRTPVDELRSVDSDLAGRLLQVSRLLDHGIKDNELVGSIEQEGHRYRALTVEWESIIKQVRSLPGFEDFLKPPRLSRLMDACRDGPIVVFNIAEERCDALTLVPGFNEVMHIPLPDITSEKVTQLRDQLKDMLYSSGIRMRGERAAKRVRGDEIKDCRPILADLWEGLVKPVLDSLAFLPHPDVLPRIWWCATGPLAFLPIHAAGIYDDQSVGSHVSDYVISSYTPTLSSLLQSIVPAVNSPFKLLSVIQPSAPGVSSILNTKEELEHIKRHIGSREHTILNGQEGTKERVMKAMKDSNWVHLACHGSQKQDEPTKSGLILEDGHLTLEEIIKLNLPNAEFAFLSACQTMTGEETLSDEAVHIAGGMMLAGYRGVVATMWSIEDDLAPEVADEFYRHIMVDGDRPDSRKAAEALHYSIQRLRKKGGVSLTSWIPFVHLGV
ncbi:hypothetical protein CPB86DRAFT_816256 [Serendipita vermifera]|nr:hypothetical protein CPB86DRAFT_816256 [Serendipita vermifera]